MFNKFRLGKKVLYSLKRRFGSPADLYHPTGTIINPKTGQAIVTKEKYHVRRLILLPISMNSVVAITGQTRSVNPQFPSTSLNIDNRIIILDSTDIPAGLLLSDKDYFVINRHRNKVGDRFNIQKVSYLEDDVGVLISTIFIRGGQRNEIFNLRLVERLLITEEASYD